MNLNRFDACIFTLYIVGTYIYFEIISIYTKALFAPWPVNLLFMMLLFTAIVTSIKLDKARRGRVNALGEVIVFVLAAISAIYIRAEYVEFFVFFETMEDNDLLLLHLGLNNDYTNLMSNKLVGYSGCLVLSLVLLRFTLYRVIKPQLYRLFNIDQVSFDTCPTCGRS